MDGGERIVGESGGGEAWRGLGEVEFAGARDFERRPAEGSEMAEVAAEAAPEVAEVSEEEEVGFFERQPEWRQNQMKREWAQVRLAEMQTKKVYDINAEEILAMRKLNYDLVCRHLNEPDFVPYLSEVLGMDTTQTLRTIWQVNPGTLTERFDEIVSGIRTAKMDTQGVEPEQYLLQEIERNEGHYTLRRDGTFSPEVRRMGCEEKVRVIQVARERGLGVSEEMMEGLVSAAGREEETGIFEQELEGLIAAGMKPERIARTLAQEGALGMLERQRERMKAEGVDIDREIRRDLRRKWKRGEIRTVLGRREEYEERGLDVDTFVRKVIAKGHTREARECPTEMMALGYTQESLDELDLLRTPVERSGLKAEDVRAESLPAEVKAEEAEIFARVAERRDERAAKKCLANFAERKWGRMDYAQRMKALETYVRMLVHDFGIALPCRVDFVPAEEYEREKDNGVYDGLTTYGQQETQYIRRGDANEGEFGETMHKVGIPDAWLLEARVTVNADIYEDGKKLSDTLAHEFWHAFQAQQAFLWEKGYFAEGTLLKKHEAFPETPKIAEYYSANFQNGVYISGEDSYEDYRHQLVEEEAFRMGEEYAGMIDEEGLAGRAKAGISELAKKVKGGLRLGKE